MAIINIGILAHVDAGKTSLTERILFETGVIRALGSVDKGTTQTDTLDLERARGITIKSAVVSFHLDDLTVNLIDTPGHADFVAEVARSLRVLDGVVLVVSAVEGVQPQTRRLARAIRAARLPLLVFVNKIDRLGARGEPLMADLRRKLGLRVVAMNTPMTLGDRAATVAPCNRADPAWRETLIDLLAETNNDVIAAYDRAGGDLDDGYLETELRSQVASGDIVPVFFGAAITGAGAGDLLAGVETWLPPAAADAGAPTVGTIFKIGYRPSGEKLVFARLFAGSLAVRQRVVLRRRDAFGDVVTREERITAIDRFGRNGTNVPDVARAGEIVIAHGLRSARIGDWIGDGGSEAPDLAPAFPAPALESIVRPADPAQITRMRTALEQLAEQDPFISLRQRNDQGEVSIRLYGEVQKEVLAETLARDFGLRVHFGPTRTICIERPLGAGEAVEAMGGDNPFHATVGFRIAPAPIGSGRRYERELGSLPLAFYRAIEESVHETLAQGLHGWEVTDCRITLTQAGFSSVLSTAGDFRKLTPLVLMAALREAGVTVCEPVDDREWEMPVEAFGAVCGALISARATIRNSYREGAEQRMICEIPTAEWRAIEQQLPGLTHGEGDWTSGFAGYIPVSGDPPSHARVGPNPLNRAHYLAEVARG
ncbi:MAG: translation factor GTPase family protein [Thermomicrobiales bacterium]